MMGAFEGNAVGVVLEFSDGTISKVRVRKAMAYPGGGLHWVSGGQLFDDGKLTLTLWRVLCSGKAMT